MYRVLPLAALLLAVAASAQPQRVPRTRAVLVPPPGYRVADAFAGFQNDDLGASLIVMELAGAPLAEMTDEMTPDALRTQGIRVTKTQDVTVAGVASRLIEGTQSAYGETYVKWILLTGDDKAVFLLTGMVPKAQAAADGPALVAAMRSVTWGESQPTDLFEGLGFTLDTPADLPDRQRLGATLLLADGIGADRGDAPLYIAALGAAPLVGSLAAATEARLRQTAGLTVSGPVRGHPVTVDGERGYEVVTEGRDGDGDGDGDGDPVTVYLVLVPTEAGYVAFQGLVGRPKAETWVPQFRALTESVRWDR